MKDLIEYISKLDDNCKRHSDCIKSKCPMYLTRGHDPNNNRCALQLLMIRLSDSTPNRWRIILKRFEEELK